MAKGLDLFKVITQGSLSPDDFKVLNLLYLPIIGTDALAIYFVMNHLLDMNIYQSDKYKHTFLIDILNIKLKSFNAAREKLEAMNLLTTHKKENEFIYQLKSPLTPKQFLKDSILGQFLVNEIGEKNYFKLTKKFKVELLDISGYKDITKQFDDLYDFVPNQFYDQNQYLEKKRNGGIVIQNKIDFEKFIELLPNRLKKPSLLNWETQEYIQKLAFVYRFDEKELSEIYQNTASRNGDINLQSLDLKAQMLYQNKLESTPKIENKLNNDSDIMVKYLKEVSPQEIISDYGKKEVEPQAVQTVFDLIKRNDIEIGVINAMLLHILKQKEGVLPHINYLEKVLASWLNKGIKNTDEALKFVMSLEQSREISNSTYTKRTSQVNKKASEWTPSWVDDYYKELEEMEDN